MLNRIAEIIEEKLDEKELLGKKFRYSKRSVRGIVER